MNVRHSLFSLLALGGLTLPCMAQDHMQFAPPPFGPDGRPLAPAAQGVNTPPTGVSSFGATSTPLPTTTNAQPLDASRDCADDLLSTSSCAAKADVSCGELACGCNEGCGCGFVAGVEATFLAPNISRDTIVFRHTDAPVFRSTDYCGLDHMEAAPRIWLGLENDLGWGVRTRYWIFDAEQQGGSVDLNNGMLVAGNENFEAYTIDLEATKRFRDDLWDILASIGVRYAHRETNENFNLTMADENLGLASVMTDQAQGTGITGALEGARSLGCYGFSVVGGVRGSVVWGPSQTGLAAHLFNDGGAGSGSSMLAYGTSATAATYIFETQIGLRWAWRLACVETDVFTQLAYEYQRWDSDDCAPAEYAAFVTHAPGSTSIVSGQTFGREIEFNGLAWSIGFKR